MARKVCFLFGIIVLLTSCTAPLEPIPMTAVPISSPTTPPAIPTQTVQPTLYPADSEFPAAGICATVDQEIVEVVVSPEGPPAPRCFKVRSDQRLKFTNGTQNEIELQAAGYKIHLGIGESYLLDIAVGDFLAPGDHLITVSAGNGFATEIWYTN